LQLLGKPLIGGQEHIERGPLQDLGGEAAGGAEGKLELDARVAGLEAGLEFLQHAAQIARGGHGHLHRLGLGLAGEPQGEGATEQEGV
jgi:hypothetical protein